MAQLEEPSSRATSRASSSAMKGLPVVVRLIDPPLHEFLPNLEEHPRRGHQAPVMPQRRSRQGPAGH